MTEELTLDDWMLMSKCVMHFADCAINDFRNKKMPMIGAAGTAGDKYAALAHDLKTLSIKSTMS